MKIDTKASRSVKQIPIYSNRLESKSGPVGPDFFAFWC